MGSCRSAILCQVASIVVITCAAYVGSLDGAWQFDDEHVIVTNPTVRDAGAALRQVGTSTRSLVHWTFALNYHIGGLDPFGYHLVNVLIHVAAALTLYGWLRSVAAAPGLAWAAALLFAVHPLATQAVTYVAQRYSSMAGLFFFASLWAWSLYRSRGARRWYVMSLLAALAAMLCKEMAIAVPISLLVADGALHRRRHQGDMSVLRRVGEYVPVAALVIVVPWLNLVNRDMPLESFAESLNWAAGTDLTPGTYFLSQLSVLVFVYLRLMLWPVGLSLQHSVQTVVWPGDPLTFAAAAILIGMLMASLAAAFSAASARVRLAGFGGLLFFLGLGATSSFVPNSELVQEQRTYVSLAGIVTAGSALAWPILVDRTHLRAAVVAGLATVLAWGTAQRNAVWRSAESLWRDAIAKAPEAPRAHANLALALAELGRTEEAIRHYRRALALDAHHVYALNNLGNLYLSLGRTEEAVQAYARAVEFAPGYTEVHSNLGAAYEKLGRLDEAIAHFRTALRQRPEYADAHNNLGNVLRARGEAGESVRHYQKAIAWYQRFDRPERQARACNNLANALADLGRYDDALPFYAEALRLFPQYVRAMTNSAHVLRAIGRTMEADALLERARRTEPGGIAPPADVVPPHSAGQLSSQ